MSAAASGGQALAGRASKAFYRPVPGWHSGRHEYPNPENLVVDDTLCIYRTNNQPQPPPSPMASPKHATRVPSLAIVHSVMRGFGWDQEYRHSRPQEEAAPQHVEIREDVNHDREPWAGSTRGSRSGACLA